MERDDVDLADLDDVERDNAELDTMVVKDYEAG